MTSLGKAVPSNPLTQSDKFQKPFLLRNLPCILRERCPRQKQSLEGRWWGCAHHGGGVPIRGSPSGGSPSGRGVSIRGGPHQGFRANLCQQSLEAEFIKYSQSLCLRGFLQELVSGCGSTNTSRIWHF